MSNISLSQCREIADRSAARELNCIDSDCAECLYEAGRLALKKALAAVIEHELSPEEQTALRLRWFYKKKISEIGRATKLSPYTVKGCLSSAEEKIYSSLKYVVLYNSLIDGVTPLPDSFHFKIINCLNGKELIS